MPTAQQVAEQHLRAVKALKVAMELSVSSTSMEVGKYTSFSIFARRYNSLVESAVKHFNIPTIGLNRFNVDEFPNSGSLTWPQQKQYFDSVYAETLVLVAALESLSGGSEKITSEISQFFSSNLRKAIFRKPESEREVQDAMETLLIGRGFQKGTEYDRESGRVKFSGKEFVPDFVLLPQSVAIEVKLIKDLQRIKSAIEEMNADVAALRTKYDRLLFVVYDLGYIRDEYEFRSSLEKIEGVDVCLVKH